MEYEIELKLLAPKNAVDLIKTRFLPQLSINVESSQKELGNRYFDTPERLLRQLDMGLRIRKSDKDFEQTLKTAGKSIGGLHQRPEYNVVLEPEESIFPDLSKFDTNIWPKGFDIELVQRQLEVLFATNFIRRIYQLTFPNLGQVEMVFDKGEIVSGENSVPICEIELELKQGAPELLFDIAKQLCQCMPLDIGTDSKAARGYRLLSSEKVKLPSLVPLSSSSLDSSELIACIERCLTVFQVNSAKRHDTFTYSDLALAFEALNQLVKLLTQLEKVFPEKALINLNIELQAWFEEWQNLCAERHLANQQEKVSVDKLNRLYPPKVTEYQLDIMRILVLYSAKANKN